MADLLYPYYQLIANGPNETGLVVTLHIQEGAGGPLPGQTAQGVVEDMRQRLAAGDGVTTNLSRCEITTNNL